MEATARATESITLECEGNRAKITLRPVGQGQAKLEVMALNCEMDQQGPGPGTFLLSGAEGWEGPDKEETH